MGDLIINSEPVIIYPPPRKENRLKQLAFALFLIASIGAIAIGMASLGGHQGWWSSRQLTQIPPLYDYVMIAGGSLCFLGIITFVTRTFRKKKPLFGDKPSQTSRGKLKEEIEPAKAVMISKIDSVLAKGESLLDRIEKGSKLKRASQNKIEKVSIIGNLYFGKTRWEETFPVCAGDLLPLPENLEKVLDEPCPFTPGMKRKDTHMLVLMPGGLSLNNLKKIVEKPSKGKASTFYEYSEEIAKKFGEKEIEKPYWVLMTRYIIPDSLNKKYPEHQKMVSVMGYRLPTALEAATCILTEFSSDGAVLFENTRTTTQDCWDEEKGFPCAVGMMNEKSGLDVGAETTRGAKNGAAAVYIFIAD